MHLESQRGLRAAHSRINWLHHFVHERQWVNITFRKQRINAKPFALKYLHDPRRRG